MHAEDDYADRLVALHNLRGRLDAVEQWHRDIHDDDVGIGLGGHAHRLAAVACFAHDVDAGLLFEKEAEALADYAVIICQ
jgi:hypothetical protein